MHKQAGVFVFCVYLCLFIVTIWQYKHIWFTISSLLSVISIFGVLYIINFEERNLDIQYSRTVQV